ncbi:MAG: alternative ribosome rescue aminoacyl-tRNA hydrolase ArfB [Thermodesulfobacteriota bacterium]
MSASQEKQLRITATLALAESEIEFCQVRAQGPGGQHGDKASTAVHLRFDIHASSLPEQHKTRLLRFADGRITAEGVVVIKAQEFRSREQNRAEALRRLAELIAEATFIPKRRRPTRPGRAARQRRLDAKKQRGESKALRKKIDC